MFLYVEVVYTFNSSVSLAQAVHSINATFLLFLFLAMHSLIMTFISCLLSFVLLRIKNEWSFFSSENKFVLY